MTESRLPGTLYLIPTPLCPATPASLQASLPVAVWQRIAQLTHFYVEHAKTARAVLQAVNTLQPLAWPIQALQLLTYDQHTPEQDLPRLIEPLLAGIDAGLMSEAGAPVIADPGAPLIAYARAQGIPIVPLVGPSAITLALMASGFGAQRFAFNGYLPIEPAARASALRQFEARAYAEDQVQVFIETPFRNEQWWHSAINHLQAQTQLCVASQLTADDELIASLSISQWQQQGVPAIQKMPTVFIVAAPTARTASTKSRVPAPGLSRRQSNAAK